jgi:hypothetical protein
MLNQRDSASPVKAMVMIAALRATDSPDLRLAQVTGPRARRRSTAFPTTVEKPAQRRTKRPPSP